jgi:hypothetical protein
MEQCLICNNKTKGMVEMNRGYYCMKHWEIGKVLQDIDLQNEEFKERSRMWKDLNMWGVK